MTASDDRAQRRRNPQYQPGAGDVRAAAAAHQEPCRCTHSESLHAEGQRRGRRAITACTFIGPGGPCGCRLYTPQGAS